MAGGVVADCVVLDELVEVTRFAGGCCGAASVSLAASELACSRDRLLLGAIGASADVSMRDEELAVGCCPPAALP